jgi:cytochrome P450
MSLQDDEHSFQRRLISTAMLPKAIEQAINFLQKGVTEQIDHLL